MYPGYGNGTSLVDNIVNSFQGTYREALRVKRDVANCIHMYDELHPIADMVTMDGVTRRLLVLSGTIPINYMQTIYNFPIELVVPEAYPFKPPRFRVTPTGNLRIKPRHRHVDDQGVVFHPYLSSWNPTQSNMAELVLQVAMAFGEDPPLYAQQAATPPPPPPIMSASSSQSLNGRGAGVPPPPYQTQVPPPVYQQKPPPPPPISSGSASSIPRPPISSSSFSNVPPPPIQTIQPTAAVYRTRVADKLKLRCGTMFPKMQQELQTELENSEKLARNGEEIQTRVMQLQSLEQLLTQQIEEVSTKSGELQSYILAQKEHREEIHSNLEMYVQPSDAATNQLFQCVADSLAIDDVLYHLNTALMRQQLDLKSFLKQARALSREQFFKIALARKINQSQHQPELTAPPPEILRPRPAGTGSSSGQYPSIPPAHYPQLRPPSYNGIS